MAILLLFLLVVVMVVGTVLPQHQSLGRYIGLYGKYAGRIITFLGLNDAFHSILFNFLMALFGINLLVCSINRLELLERMLFNPKVKKNKKSISLLEDSRTISPEEGSGGRLIERAERLLEKKNYTSFSEEEEDKKYLLFQKGKWGRLGPEVVHLSLIIILIGGIISGLGGFSTTLEVAEGERAPIPRTNSSLKLNDFSLSYYDDRYRLDLYKPANGSFQHDKQLVLSVGKPKRYGNMELLLRKTSEDSPASGNLLLIARTEEDEQVVEFSGKSQEVMLHGEVGGVLSRFHKQYTSEVEVISPDGDLVKKASVKVNSPIAANGVKLYQQAYELGTSEVPEAEWVTLEAYESTGDGSQPIWKGKVNLGEKITVTETTSIVATKFYPNLSIDETGKSVNVSEAPENPSVYLQVKRNRMGEASNNPDQDLNRWIFLKYGDIHYDTVAGEGSEALRFSLTDFGPVVKGGDKSVFQVSATPGINVVYTGFGLILLGLALSFFVFHRRIWIIQDEKNGEIYVGGKSNKEIHSFSEDLEELYDELDRGAK